MKNLVVKGLSSLPEIKEELKVMVKDYSELVVTKEAESIKEASKVLALFKEEDKIIKGVVSHNKQVIHTAMTEGKAKAVSMGDELMSIYKERKDEIADKIKVAKAEKAADLAEKKRIKAEKEAAQHKIAVGYLGKLEDILNEEDPVKLFEISVEAQTTKIYKKDLGKSFGLAQKILTKVMKAALKKKKEIDARIEEEKNNPPKEEVVSENTSPSFEEHAQGTPSEGGDDKEDISSKSTPMQEPSVGSSKKEFKKEYLSSFNIQGHHDGFIEGKVITNSLKSSENPFRAKSIDKYNISAEITCQEDMKGFIDFLVEVVNSLPKSK